MILILIFRQDGYNKSNELQVKIFQHCYDFNSEWHIWWLILVILPL